jgi:hypothetical protein
MSVQSTVAFIVQPDTFQLVYFNKSNIESTQKTLGHYKQC